MNSFLLSLCRWQAINYPPLKCRIRITAKYEELEELSESEEDMEWALQETHPTSDEEHAGPLLMVVTENIASKPFEKNQEIQVW